MYEIIGLKKLGPDRSPVIRGVCAEIPDTPVVVNEPHKPRVFYTVALTRCQGKYYSFGYRNIRGKTYVIIRSRKCKHSSGRFLYITPRLCFFVSL